MAGAAAEAGAAEKAAESLIFCGLIDHIIAKTLLRDAPMRPSACLETDLPRK
jgi:hypothetical protein